MKDVNIKALTRIKENYERLWQENLTKEEDVKEEYDAVCAGIKALERADLEGCSYRLWKAAYERGKADAEPRWIPVMERLPEVDVDVLVTDNGGGVPTVIVDACGMKDDTGERFWYISQTPIAWMKWPEPCEAESEDKEVDG